MTSRKSQTFPSLRHLVRHGPRYTSTIQFKFKFTTSFPLLKQASSSAPTQLRTFSLGTPSLLASRKKACVMAHAHGFLVSITSWSAVSGCWKSLHLPLSPFVPPVTSSHPSSTRSIWYSLVIDDSSEVYLSSPPLCLCLHHPLVSSQASSPKEWEKTRFWC